LEDAWQNNRMQISSPQWSVFVLLFLYIRVYKSRIDHQSYQVRLEWGGIRSSLNKWVFFSKEKNWGTKVMVKDALQKKAWKQLKFF